MKKILSLILVGLLLLTGCGNKAAQVSNKNDTIVTVGDKNITKGELYSYMNAYISSASYLSLRKLIVKHHVPLTEEIEKEAKANLQEDKDILEDKFLETIMEMGYKNETDYYENSVLQTVLAIHMFQEYAKNNISALVETYNPYQVRLMRFDDEKVADQALNKVKEGEEFEAVAKEFSNQYYEGEKEVVINTSNYPKVVLEAIAKQTGPTLIQEAINDSTNSKYYVIQVISNDITHFETEFIDVVQHEESLINDMYGEYAKAGNFKVYDINVYKTLTDNYPDLFK